MMRSTVRPALNLEYPMSVAVFDSYEQAQRVVDYLSDNAFPVQNVAIVGTDLRSVERVTGRLTRRKIALAGAFSGLWMGWFVGLALVLFGKSGQAGFLFVAPVLGAVFGLAWSQLGFGAATRKGTRDFSSISQVVAGRYEVLVEHRYAEQARVLVAGMSLV